MRQLHFDLLRLLEDDRQGSHGSRRARRYVLAQAAETLHRLGYRGLRARGLKGRHIEALVAEWHRQGLADGTMNPSCPGLKNFLHQYVEGYSLRPVTTSVRTRRRCARAKGSAGNPGIWESRGRRVWGVSPTSPTRHLKR